MNLQRSLAPLVLVTAIGCGVVGGVFFAFSTFIMRALDQVTPSQGVATMQRINVTVLTPWFMVVLFGAALSCVALAVAAVFRWDHPGARYQLAGAVLYLVGIVVTVAYHVPHNDALARWDPVSAQAAGQWSGWVTAWTAWNHVRTVTSIAAAALLTVAYRAG